MHLAHTTLTYSCTQSQQDSSARGMFQFLVSTAYSVAPNAALSMLLFLSIEALESCLQFGLSHVFLVAMQPCF